MDLTISLSNLTRTGVLHSPTRVQHAPDQDCTHRCAFVVMWWAVRNIRILYSTAARGGFFSLSAPGTEITYLPSSVAQRTDKHCNPPSLPLQTRTPDQLSAPPSHTAHPSLPQTRSLTTAVPATRPQPSHAHLASSLTSAWCMPSEKRVRARPRKLSPRRLIRRVVRRVLTN